jgi:hypothetical protein
MARASVACENRALGGMFAAAAPSVSTTSFWVALFTADPTTSGASGEASGGGYARVQFSVGTPTSGTVSNTGTMSFTTSGSTANTHIGTFDASTAGNYQIGAALTSPVTAVTITFAAAAIQFSAS